MILGEKTPVSGKLKTKFDACVAMVRWDAHSDDLLFSSHRDFSLRFVREQIRCNPDWVVCMKNIKVGFVRLLDRQKLVALASVKANRGNPCVAITVRVPHDFLLCGISISLQF